MWRGSVPILCLFLGACSAPAVRVVPIVDPETTFQLDTFAIMAPGENWYVVDRQPRRIGFVRYGASWSESWGAEAQSVNIDFEFHGAEDFFARLGSLRDTFTADPRFEVLEVRATRERFMGMSCQRSRLRVRDRGAINRGASLYLLLQLLSLSCLPADRPANVPPYMIELRFSHRGREQASWGELESRAEAFFRGMRPEFRVDARAR